MFKILKSAGKPLVKRASNYQKHFKNQLKDHLQNIGTNMLSNVAPTVTSGNSTDGNKNTITNGSSSAPQDIIDNIVIQLMNLKQQIRGTKFGDSTFFSPTVINTHKRMPRSGTVAIYAPLKEYTNHLTGDLYIKVFVKEGSNTARKHIRDDSLFEPVVTLANNRYVYRRIGTGRSSARFGCGTPAGCHFGGLADTYKIQGPYGRFGKLPDTLSISAPYNTPSTARASTAKFGGQYVSNLNLYDSPVSFTQTPNAVSTAAKVSTAAAHFGNIVNPNGLSSTARFGCCNNRSRFGCNSSPRFGCTPSSRFGEENYDTNMNETDDRTDTTSFGFYGQYRN